MPTAPSPSSPLPHSTEPTAFSMMSDPTAPTPRLQLIATRSASATPVISTDVLAWPVQQLWTHPDATAFRARIADVVDHVSAKVASLPPRLTAGPLSCATAQNVAEFRHQGQRDRAWRLAARLIERAADDQPVRQDTLDLAVSAYLLAVQEGGCVIAAVEGAAVIDRLIAVAETMPLDYPGLGLSGENLTVQLRCRRAALLDHAVAGAGKAPGSKAAVEALMYRAPLLARRRA